jgi:hypothetical protein
VRLIGATTMKRGEEIAGKPGGVGPGGLIKREAAGP